ncbi:hypothetical protein C8R45DRAFT_931628 [Mycena sanguinolenta]|nr:hypothetical protein C8R45DRAFT_931628 [Mycena sanguinolenta]
MASFDPPVVLAILVAAQPSAKRKKFEEVYKANVDRRVKAWMKNRGNQSQYHPQLEFEANVAEYVLHVFRETRPERTTGTSNKINKPKTLHPSTPIYGPKFVPPSLTDVRHRAGKIQPQAAYLRPINIIHPFYYPMLAKCPYCGSQDVSWDSWNGTGSREVHGLKREETALGYQLRHDECIPDEGGGGTKKRSFATTNQVFWQGWQHWQIPRGIPYFFSRCAVTRELFDIIIEFRLSGTSAGLEENIKQLHLLEYHEHTLEYLQAYKNAYTNSDSLLFFQTSIIPFSSPSKEGYNDKSISDELIREVYMAFVNRTRSGESIEYLQNLTPGVCLSVDNTFKAAGKATVVDTSKTRTKLMKGGILSVLNEFNEIVAWRFCQLASPVEMFEVLEGIKKRCQELGVELPEMLVADNCCQVEKEAHRSMPDLQMCLDVYHFMMRYLAAILNGVNNPYRAAVAAEIRNAVLKRPANKGVPAQYWTKEEQEMKVCEVYDKYSQLGGVWSAAAQAVHAAQLKHLRKGCLSRRRQDIASDGSRIEGSHKGWNSIQRSFASGLELQNALGHDHVLRRNVRVAFSRNPSAPASHLFVRSTFGSHHTRLVSQTGTLFNEILQFEARKKKIVVPTTSLQPTLRTVRTGEIFGLVHSQSNDTFSGLLTIKSEDDDSVEEDKLFTDAIESPVDPTVILEGLAIDPALLLQPQHEDSGPQSLIADATVIEVIDLPITGKRKEPDTPATTEPHSVERDVLPEAKKPRLGEMESSSSTSKPLHGFFTRTASISAPTVIPQPSNSSGSTAIIQSEIELSKLTQSLPLPAAESNIETPGLTRSQRLFLAGTGTNPKALEISAGPQFYLFMELREKLQWKASDMTPKKWAEAVGQYNDHLCTKDPKEPPKASRALISKLGEVERQVLDRLTTKNFTSQKGSDSFWRRHCFAVGLVKSEESDLRKKDDKSSSRKVAACMRCHKVMYPGKTGSPENHKKGYCSDGFKQKTSAEESTLWPQPAGIFSTGSEFHPVSFLAAVRNLYDKVVLQTGSNLSVEEEAFSVMLQEPGRTLNVNDAVLFKLFAGYNIPAGDKIPDTYFVEYQGSRYLRIDALSGTDGPVSQP